jgi:hypothetical protein
MLDLIYGPRATQSLAHSALPGAPVVGDDAPGRARTRSAAAALLRRAADRLAPEPRGLPAS